MSGNTVRFKAGLGNRKQNWEPAREQPAETHRAPAFRLARQLALAYFIEREIEAGRIRDYAEAARRLGMSRARMRYVMDLLGLVTSVQETILKDGT